MTKRNQHLCVRIENLEGVPYYEGERLFDPNNLKGAINYAMKLAKSINWMDDSEEKRRVALYRAER